MIIIEWLMNSKEIHENDINKLIAASLASETCE